MSHFPQQHIQQLRVPLLSPLLQSVTRIAAAAAARACKSDLLKVQQLLLLPGMLELRVKYV
jgi:hypothetical protein